jgi:glycosyltransferase involved in cell wall biosynthesis
MRVAQIIDTLSWGGVQELQVTLAAMARPEELELTLVSLRHDVGTPYRDRLEALGVPTVIFPSRTVVSPKRLWSLTRFLRAGRFDVVHTHLASANTVGVVAARLAGIPAIGALHLSTFGRHPPRRQRLETWALRRVARAVTACGHAVADVHRERLRGTSIRVIPNAVRIDPVATPAERSRIRSELLGDADVPVMLTVGRLSPEKGVDDLITAVARVYAAGRTCRLLVAGAGVLHSKLQARVNELGLQDVVSLLGGRDDVPRLLAASDIFVNAATHSEGLSISILEAMAAGLPVVATDVGDSSRVVVPGTGCVVPAGAPEALAEALGSLLDDPARRQECGAAARAHVERHYSAQVWHDQMLALYKSVVSAERSGL